MWTKRAAYRVNVFINTPSIRTLFSKLRLRPQKTPIGSKNFQIYRNYEIKNKRDKISFESISVDLIRDITAYFFSSLVIESL